MCQARLTSRAVLTTVIGSYPQPDWLIDRERLRGSLPPRVRMRELWRVEEPYLAQAQDDATALAIRDQERAGVDIVSDGEIRRESYSNRFATALEGFDIDNPAMVPGRAGGTNAVPRIVGKVRRTRAGRGRRPALPARPHRPHDQDHAARPVHDEPAGVQRVLRRRGRAGDGPRGGGQRGGPRAVRGRRRRRADRRAVAAVTRGEGARVRAPGHRPRAGRRAGHDRAAHLLRLRPRRPRPAGRLPVPGRARGLRGGRARDRGGAVRGSTPACSSRSPARR